MVNKSLIRVINQIGLSTKHALVYEALLAKKSATPVQLARETQLNRSSIYRYLEELREKGLVEMLLADKSSRYGANPEGLNQYLITEESRVEKLRDAIPTLVNQLYSGSTTKTSGTDVKYFEGVEGLRQMLWNAVRSGTEIIGLGYEDWNTSVGKNYADKLRKKIFEAKSMSREILNVADDNYAFTTLGKTYSKVHTHRVISPAILEIKHDSYIYGEVFAFYYHYQGEYFGVEIHNKEIARTERQMFEILWKMADKI